MGCLVQATNNITRSPARPDNLHLQEVTCRDGENNLVRLDSVRRASVGRDVSVKESAVGLIKEGRSIANDLLNIRTQRNAGIPNGEGAFGEDVEGGGMEPNEQRLCMIGISRFRKGIWIS